ncbi:hypothetical protein ABK040_002937 [Willaertia magna]
MNQQHFQPPPPPQQQQQGNLPRIQRGGNANNRMHNNHNRHHNNQQQNNNNNGMMNPMMNNQNMQQQQSFPVGPHEEGPVTPNYVQQPQSKMVFDGKRMRKAIERQFIDYNPTVIQSIRGRIFERSKRDIPYVPPHPAYETYLLPPSAYRYNPTTCITTKFEHISTNKQRCPINVVCWTPDGRRLLTGASTGEFTLWNGQAFNFETIQQAHDSPIRAMVWNHNDTFMVSADNGGVIKYWQSNMNNIMTYKGHEECIRDIGFSPTDSKFCSCSDDGTVKVWDFTTYSVDKTLSGHGSDVRCCDWHPRNSLIASGAKDYLIKLWDAKSGQNVATLHGHKNTIFNIKWNMNGNWLLSCSKDQLIKMYDIRYLKEFQTFKGHNREVTCLAWHPHHETLFASGSYDGNIIFWIVGTETPQAKIKGAHDSAVWDISWHPFGHVLCSGSNDYATKFWVRNRPGDKMDDKYNIHELPPELQLRVTTQKMEEETMMMDDHIVSDVTPSLPGLGNVGLPGLGGIGMSPYGNMMNNSSLPGIGFGNNSSGGLPGLGL